MPLDGTDEALTLARLENENENMLLKRAMFELRPPETQVLNDLPLPNGSLPRALTRLISKGDVVGLVRLCSDHKRLMAQNTEIVTCPIGYVHKEFKVNGRAYFTPHGFIDWYLWETLGAYPGCGRALEETALVYLRVIERQHANLWRSRRKALEHEQELAVLLEAA